MFFVLSKVLVFLIQPFIWIVAGFCYAAVTRHRERGKRVLRLALVLTLLLTNPVFLNFVTRAWEISPTPVTEIREPFDIAIVLGGFSRPGQEPRDRLHLSSEPNRLSNAIELYYAGKARRILITGGSAAIAGEKIPESPRVKQFLLGIGIPEDDILIESRSRNTAENASRTAALVRDRYPEAKCLLITSAFHMRRARACFAKAGLKVTPFSTDMRADPIDAITPALLIPNPSGFELTYRLLKESVGCAVYRMKGFI